MRSESQQLTQIIQKKETSEQLVAKEVKQIQKVSQAKTQRLVQWIKRKFEPKNLFQMARSPSQLIEEQEEEEEWFEPLEQDLTQKWQVDLMKH